jgi:hypothetical protein
MATRERTHQELDIKSEVRIADPNLIAVLNRGGFKDAYAVQK